MSARAVITGVGLVTPLGAAASETWDALLAGRSIAGHSKVPIEFPPGLPRVSHLAIRAANEACGAGVPDNAALVVATSKGPVESWLAPPSRLSDVMGPIDFGLSRVASDVAAALGIGGPRLTVSTACASGLHALIRGVLMIETGEAHRVLVVAAEASVHPLFIGSFLRLGIIAGEEAGCRPFDQSREGFWISEAAAAVLLERADPQKSGVAVDRVAMAADATHLTRNSDDAVPLARALEQVCAGNPVDLIHAHGTGTLHNDASELAVLEKLAEGQQFRPHVYSHKGALGHSLGATGLVSVAINVLAHQHGVVPPNCRTTRPMPVQNLKLSRVPAPRKIARSVALAAGFGGQIAAVSLVNVPEV
ncbi:MAG TPA: beta-ketoacyl synthase N-terminal-like domain-containing protein [Tepidisphaeraceae bacterium]|nr:beta-ketoacyl synthase N-terminal-like domain-containing protein [Tepidisphaeraceae bacterium]